MAEAHVADQIKPEQDDSGKSPSAGTTRYERGTKETLQKPGALALRQLS
ncbi:MAG: hypothetical protein ACLR0U_18280 [Enterocloster clostridioformis]